MVKIDNWDLMKEIKVVERYQESEYEEEMLKMKSW